MRSAQVAVLGEARLEQGAGEFHRPNRAAGPRLLGREGAGRGAEEDPAHVALPSGRLVTRSRGVAMSVWMGKLLVGPELGCIGTDRQRQ